MALALKPRLLLLDEPTAGMGDQETYDITQLIRRLHRDQKLTIVLIEHDMRVVFHLADRIMVLAEGAVLAEGTPPEIAAQRGGAGGLSREGGMSDAVAPGRGAAHLLRQEPHPARRRSRSARGRDRDPARPQRRRQDHDACAASWDSPRRARARCASSATPRRDWPPYRIAALGVGYVPEGRRIFANLTVEENLKVPANGRGPGPSRASTSSSRAWPSASPTRAASSRAASRRCCRSRARCCSTRKLLLLDEPSQGLAPLIVQEVFRVVAAARGEGISVLLVEQNVRAAVEIADRAYVLDDGRVVFHGSAAEFAQRRGARPRARRRQRRGVDRARRLRRYGVACSWNSRGAGSPHGPLVPSPPFTRVGWCTPVTDASANANGEVCRQYQRDIVFKDGKQTGGDVGVTCRDANGDWVAKS